MAAADAPPTEWPKVECDTEGCTTTEHWKRMRNVKRTEFCAKYKGDGGDVFTWIRTCWQCVMQIQGLEPEGEARAFIDTNCPAYQAKKLRASEHRESNENIRETFPLLTSSKERRQLTRDDINKDILSPSSYS